MNCGTAPGRLPPSPIFVVLYRWMMLCHARIMAHSGRDVNYFEKLFGLRAFRRRRLALGLHPRIENPPGLTLACLSPVSNLTQTIDK